MEQIPLKTDGDTYTSSEFNNVESQEPQNLVLGAGLVLDPNNLTQMKEAAHIVSSFSISYTDSGAVNAYVLTNVSGVAITEYIEGMSCSFTTVNTNTGASTVDVNGLGAVPIINADGSPLSGSEILNTIVNRIVYVSGNFVLVIIDGLDVELRNELLSTSTPTGVSIIGTTNALIEQMNRRAFARISNNAEATYVEINNAYNISRVDIAFVPPNQTQYVIYFINPMATDNLYTAVVTDSIGGNTANITSQNKSALTLGAKGGSNGVCFSIYEYRP